MNFQIRLILAAALSLCVLLADSYLNPKAPPVPEEKPAATSSTDAEAAGDSKSGEKADVADATNSLAAPPEDDDGTDAEVTEGQAAVEHTIGNATAKVRLANASNGMIRGVELLDEQFRRKSGKGIDFLKLGEGEYSLQLSADPEGSDLRIPRVRGEVVEQSDRVFELRRASRDLEVVERIEMLEGYELSYTTTLRNTTGEQVRVRPQWTLHMGADREASQYSIDRALCDLGVEGVEDLDHSDVDEGPEQIKGPARWAGVDSKYFAALIVPAEDDFQRCVVRMPEGSGNVERPGLLNTAVGRTLNLAPGESKVIRFGLYFGPKVIPALEGFSVVEGAGLEGSIDWGWLGGLSKWLGQQMLELMRYFQQLTGVWGVAIILLTVVVKLVTLPLTLKQMRSMKKMRELAPEMQELKEKYSDDTVKRNQELQALFARRGVNPMAGCLPMIVQLPVWFALYSMLGMAVELYRVPFLWLDDLTKPDDLFLLPITMSALMWLQMSMQPATGDPQQQAVMKWAMPAVFLFMMLFLPSGLGVYIFANTLLSVIQTFVQLRPDKPAGQSQPASS